MPRRGTAPSGTARISFLREGVTCQVSLTTYRKDGTPRATAVWHAMDGERLYVRSAADAWKVKRLRRDSRAEVAVCDVRGRVAPDAVRATGTGRVLDEEGTKKAGRCCGGST
ncbi:PPOX class F420-dependent oxidoreductase [Streptomyces fractus]|uniref:PPOX class F420-dependent oxidoreductase n=1 Tax=Streptomyces fractus TaxID=641806 RepID=UPI003CF3745E